MLVYLQLGGKQKMEFSETHWLGAEQREPFMHFVTLEFPLTIFSQLTKLHNKLVTQKSILFVASFVIHLYHSKNACRQ